MSRIRILASGIALALLLTSCATPAEEEPLAAPSVEASASPSIAPVEPALLAPGEQAVPATCDELIPESQSRLGLQLQPSMLQSIGGVTGVTAGLLACHEAARTEPITAMVYVMAVPPPTWTASLRDLGGEETNGVLVHRICADDATYCVAQLATEDYAAELFITDYALSGTISRELDAIAEELGATLLSLPEPRERSTATDQASGTAGGCAALDISDSQVSDQIAPILENREEYPGSGDGPPLYYAAEARIGALWCVWSAGYDGLELNVVPGGGWAIDDPAALLAGTPIEVDGADSARWADSPYQEDAVILFAAVGEDLMMLTWRDSPIDGLFADDGVDLADRLLEAFVRSVDVN